MATAAPAIDILLTPISEERPAGDDITLAPEWMAIKEARRPDKLTERENADWPLIQQLLSDALTHKSKDLLLAVWLTEANVKVAGFAGLRESARLLYGLITQYWDKGLYPEADGGDLQFRAKPLEWLNGDNLPRAVRQIPLTARTDGSRDYSYLDYRQSRQIGWEKDIRDSLGDIDPEKEARRRAALERGGVSAEAFEEAIKSTRRAGLEVIRADLEAAWEEFHRLDQAIEEKFGAEAPGTSDAKEAFEDCRRLLEDFLRRKRQEEPDSAPANEAHPSGTPRTNSAFAPAAWDASGIPEGGGSWAKAEELVRNGQIQEGLAEMTLLAAQQYGRARFQQRLRLAEICLGIDRRRLGIAILEELTKVIDELKLDQWESSEMLGRVWGRLYQCYKSEEPGSELTARAAMLFDRLCRLDPWQALRWDA
jgi:type VI secretion system protein ImpA